MQSLLFIAAGGAAGTLLRFAVSEITFKITGAGFTWGTIAVNLIGCLLIGILWGVFSALELGNNTRLFVFAGFLGAFTTFSTFALENFHLFRNGEISMLVFNVAISNIAGILLVFYGYNLSKLLFPGAGE